MKKKNMKTKRAMTISALLVVSMILIGTIYVITNKEIQNNDLMIEADLKSGPHVESIVEQEEEVITVEVLEIETNTTIRNEDSKVDDVTIDEPIAKEPEKPENTLPEEKPQTSDNVEDMTIEPEYKEGKTIYVPKESEEVDPVSEPTTESNQNSVDEGSGLVPDSENPFANTDNVGVPEEVNGEDYYENGVPAGQGDKF